MNDIIITNDFPTTAEQRQTARRLIKSIRNDRMLGSMSALEELDLAAMNVSDDDVAFREEFNAAMNVALAEFDKGIDAESFRAMLPTDETGAWERIYRCKQHAAAFFKRYAAFDNAALVETVRLVGQRNGVDLIAVLRVK